MPLIRADAAMGSEQPTLFERAPLRPQMRGESRTMPDSRRMATTDADAEEGGLRRANTPLDQLDEALGRTRGRVSRLANSPAGLMVRDAVTVSGIASVGAVAGFFGLPAGLGYSSAMTTVVSKVWPGGRNSTTRALTTFDATGDRDRKLRKMRLMGRLLDAGPRNAIALTISSSSPLVQAMEAFCQGDRELGLAALDVMRSALMAHRPGENQPGGTDGFWQSLLDEFHPIPST